MLRVRALGQDTQLPGDPFNTPDLPSEGPSWSSGQYSSPIGPNQQAPAADPITIDTTPSYRPQQVTNNYYGQQPQQPNQYSNPNQAYTAAATAALLQARYPGQINNQQQTYPGMMQQSLVNPSNISNATLIAALGGAALLVLVIALR